LELVYLWIKEEKNIIDKEINLSPRFDCEFKDGILTIKENKEYINIFPKNINIHGIVGENGSGKTSLIKNIFNGINPHTISYDQKRELACWLNYEKNCIYIHTTLDDLTEEKIISDFKFKIEKTVKSFYNPDEGYEKEKFESFFYYYSSNLEIDYELNEGYELNDKYIIHSELDKRYNKIDLELNDKKLLNNILSYLLDKHKNISTTIQDFFVPEELFIKKNLIKVLNNNQDEELYVDFKSKYRDYGKVLTKIEILLYFKNGFEEQFINTNTVINAHLEDLENYLESENSKIFNIDTIDELFNEVKNQYFNKLIDGIEDARKTILSNHNVGNDDSSKIINEVEKAINFANNFENLFLLIKNITQTEFEIDIDKIDEENISNLKDLPSFLEIALYQQKGVYQVSLSELSSGEQNLLRIIYAIKNIIRVRKNSTKTFNIFLDEIENTLHPNWQRKIVYWIIESLKDYDKHFNIYIASHSPFVVSDLPKENIIFMKKGEKITPFEEEQTFGANIHTLLSHSFFMEDGLMGEYAKRKINDLISDLNNKELNMSIENKRKMLFEINLIGEPFLKTKLLDMYYKKFKDDFIKKERKSELESMKLKIEEELSKL
jgi:ABC-type multidrug transport system ATPase subunit